MLYQYLDVLVGGDTIIVSLHHDVDVVNLGLELQGLVLVQQNFLQIS
jgi:hypothetical protein